MPKLWNKVRKSDMIRFDNNHWFAYERIGEFHSAGSWIHPTRIISSYEVILVLEGTVYLREGNAEYALKQNQMLLLEPGTEHGGIREVTEPTAFYWFHFRTDLPVNFKTYFGPDYYDIKQLMKRLLHTTNTPGYSTGAADALSYLIFQELILRGPEEQPTNRVHVNQILEYIKVNQSRNLTVAELAEHFNYNVDYMGKLFRKNVGIGLKEYLAEERMKLAKDLLLTTDRTVKQIGEEMGYSSENLFVKFFMYHEKISPSVFRSLYYNTHLNNQ
jgi:AraC-like DNA-binding protein